MKEKENNNAEQHDETEHPLQFTIYSGSGTESEIDQERDKEQVVSPRNENISQLFA